MRRILACEHALLSSDSATLDAGNRLSAYDNMEEAMCDYMLLARDLRRQEAPFSQGTNCTLRDRTLGCPNTCPMPKYPPRQVSIPTTVDGKVGWRVHPHALRN